jgi:ABC-2 type transport system ATP-binding protein
MDVLRFSTVSKAFPGRIVLEDVTLAVPPGAIVGVIGENGAGKTTLLRLAAGLLAPTAGEIRLFGQSDLVSARRHLGALLERPGHYDELTVYDNLFFFYSFYAASPAGVRDAVREALERLGLSEIASERAGRLSTGLRQRLALARAAHRSAKLLLLDEPFESLDPIARHQVKGWLQAARHAGTAAVISSHTLHDLSDLCDSLLLVADGRVRAFDSFAAISREAGLADTSNLDALYAAYRQTQPPHGVH